MLLKYGSLKMKTRIYFAVEVIHKIVKIFKNN